MKQILLALSLFLFFPCSCFAAEQVVDDFSSTQNTNWAFYQNLVSRSQDPMANFNWSDAPDQTFCSLPSPSAPASVTYQIQGATSLEVAVYSRAGTFATYNDSLKGYVLGYFNRVDPSFSRLEPWFSPSTGGLYVKSDTGLLQLTGTSLAKMFRPAAESPSDLVPYGLQVYAGSDSQNLRLIAGVRDRSKEDVNIRANLADQYYDVFQFSLPANTKIVRIVLRDYTVFPMEDGSIRTNSARNPLRLAQALFVGDSIHLGPPEESSSSQPGPSSSSSTPSSSNPSRPSGGGSSWEDDPDLESVPESSSSSEQEKEPASSSSKPVPSSSSKLPSSSDSSFPGSSSSPKIEKPSSGLSSSVASSQVLGGEPPQEDSSGKNGLFLALAIYLSAGATGLLLLLEKKRKPSDPSSKK